MSIWIRICCPESVASVTPDAMLNGIAKRMVLLGYLYSEDFPEDELPRVRVEAISSVETFESFDIRYGADQVYGFRVDRWQEPSKGIRSEADQRMSFSYDRDRGN